MRKCCSSSARDRRRPKLFAWFPPPLTIGFALPILASAPIGLGSCGRIREQSLLACYEELAQKFPQGLAGLPQLPEELSGAVHSTASMRD